MNYNFIPAMLKDASSLGCVFCKVNHSLILDSTENFYLLYDPFALIPGHLLITSREHYGCLGEVPRHLHKECSALRKKTKDLLQLVFQQPTFRYEHGRAGHCLAKGISTRSCHHYHEHLIPTDIKLHSALENHYKSIPYQDEEDICTLFEKYEEYLLLEDSNDEKRFYVTNKQEIKPHLLRTLTAEAIGVPERDNWEDYRSCEVMMKGKQAIEFFLMKENIA